MSIDMFLSRLRKVRRIGRGNRWVACCPAHKDKSPSLSITQKSDGQVLIQCFAGCSFHEIAAAVEMNPSDFFPPRTVYSKFEKYPFSPLQILASIASECRIVWAAAVALRRGCSLTELDWERINLACERIANGLEMAGVVHE